MEKKIVNYVVSGGRVTDWGECSAEEKERIAKFISSEVEEAVRSVWKEEDSSQEHP